MSTSLACPRNSIKHLLCVNDIPHLLGEKQQSLASSHTRFAPQPIDSNTEPAPNWDNRRRKTFQWWEESTVQNSLAILSNMSCAWAKPHLLEEEEQSPRMFVCPSPRSFSFGELLELTEIDPNPGHHAQVCFECLYLNFWGTVTIGNISAHLPWWGRFPLDKQINYSGTPQAILATVYGPYPTSQTQLWCALEQQCSIPWLTCKTCRRRMQRPRCSPRRKAKPFHLATATTQLGSVGSEDSAARCRLDGERNAQISSPF